MVLHTELELLTVSKISQLAGIGDATVRKDADSGRLPVQTRKADGERLFALDDAVAYAVGRRFGLDLRGVSDHQAAAAVAAAIAKSTRPQLADGYPAIVAFISLLDEADRMVVATEVQKFAHPDPRAWLGGAVQKG